MKEQVEPSKRLLFAPLMAYLFVGYGLLYAVYSLERLAERLNHHCYVFKLAIFTVTTWHEHKMWVSFAYPIAWPILAFRALMMVLLAMTCATLELVYNCLVISWVWIQPWLLEIRSVIRWILAALLASLRRWFYKIVKTLWPGFVLFWHKATDFFLSIRKRLIESLKIAGRWLTMIWRVIQRSSVAALRLLVTIAKVVWQWLLGPFRWLWAEIVLVWREAKWVMITLWRWFRLAMEWIRAGVEATWQWLLKPFRWLWAEIVLVWCEAKWVMITLWRWFRLAMEWIRAGVEATWHLLVMATDTAWQWLLRPLRWLWAELILIWHEITVMISKLGHWFQAELILVWRGLFKVVTTLRYWLLLPVRWIWAEIVTVWYWILLSMQRIQMGVIALWRQVVAAIYWIWLQIDMAAVALWRWFLRPIKLLWNWLFLAWRRIINSTVLIWQRVGRFLDLVWSQFKALVQPFGSSHQVLRDASDQELGRKPHSDFRICVLVRSAWKPVSILWARAKTWARETWLKVANFSKTQMKWLQYRLGLMRENVSILFKQIEQGIRHVWKRLWHPTGFWKRVIADIRVLQRDLIKSSSQVKESIIERSRAFNKQIRLELAVLRDSIAAVAREIRGQFVDFRDEAAEAIKNLVPRG